MKSGLVIVLALCAVGLGAISRPQPWFAGAGDENAQRERGKQIFANKCAQCHDANAEKKLPDGTTLLARLVASKDPRALLATRLNKMSSDDHEAVVLYVEGLLAHYRNLKKAASAPESN